MESSSSLGGESFFSIHGGVPPRSEGRVSSPSMEEFLLARRGEFLLHPWRSSSSLGGESFFSIHGGVSSRSEGSLYGRGLTGGEVRRVPGMETTDAHRFDACSARTGASDGVHPASYKWKKT
eukprot:scaffold2636_cov340-Pavlova_lutheri.AAC.12